MTQAVLRAAGTVGDGHEMYVVNVYLDQNGHEFTTFQGNLLYALSMPVF
jgi:hypothetical protein